ncbi:MAG TPA: DsrE family protein [Methylomirabilota bacterium]|nr:DsrE family protein [Methylomirabilota bacterium]
MSLHGRKLGILISAPPLAPNFTHGVRLAEAARRLGVDVYLYCIDEAVPGLLSMEVQRLRSEGGKIFGCALAVQARSLKITDEAVLGGLGMVSELMSATDRFVAFT